MVTPFPILPTALHFSVLSIQTGVHLLTTACQSLQNRQEYVASLNVKHSLYSNTHTFHLHSFRIYCVETCYFSGYVCNLKLDQGPCTVSVPRFYYSSENQTCLPFNYGGCSGNLNNFGSKLECERFCVGTGVDPLLDFVNDDGGAVFEIIELGFLLNGPSNFKKNREDFEK